MDILLTGGSGCGKSSLAEDILETMGGPRIYVATMIPYGEDGKMKVKRHREIRKNKNFMTIEKYVGINEIDIPKGSSVLLECICNLTANEMFEKNGAGDNAVSAVLDGVAHMKEMCDNLIVITNEVGSDGASYDKPVIEYIRAMGQINATLAESFPCVYEMCCGIPLALKGDLSWAL